MSSEEIEDIVELENVDMSLSYLNKILSNKKSFNEAKKKYKDRFYCTMLMILTHEKYKESKAKELFNEIQTHKKELKELLNRDVGIVVATMDYLYNIKKELSTPMIIEEQKSDVISQSSVKDKLTGLYAKDIFQIFLDKEFSLASRKRNDLCLIMLDIDDFKKINDSFGHQIGDEVLEKLGKTINSNIRQMDFACRYGGEEFAIIMPNSNKNDAIKLAKRLRKKVEELNFSNFNITISLGISILTQKVKNSSDLIKTADKALYSAKKRGKNRYECFSTHN